MDLNAIITIFLYIVIGSIAISPYVLITYHYIFSKPTYPDPLAAWLYCFFRNNSN